MAGSGEHPMVASWPAELGDSPSMDGERMLWGTAMTVMAIDVVTTIVGLSMGLHEGNTVVGAAVAAFGIPGLLLTKGVVLTLAAGVAGAIPDRAAPIVPLALTLPTTVAVTVNLVRLGMA